MSRRKAYPYPEDEFDIAGRGGGPDGVHRAPRSRVRTVLPWLLALLIAPVVAFVFVTFLSSMSGTDVPDDNVPTASDTPSGTKTDDETDPIVTDSPTDSPTDEPQPTDTPTPELPPVDEATNVRVLNATRIVGLAGRGQERLTQAGWTNVASSNYEGSDTRDVSVVFYSADDEEGSALEVARLLGITDVEKNADEASDGIIAVLRAEL